MPRKRTRPDAGSQVLRIFNLAIKTEIALENKQGQSEAQKEAALKKVAELYIAVCAILSSQKEAGASIDVQLLENAQWNLGVIQFKLGNVEEAFANLDAVRTRSSQDLEGDCKTYYEEVKREFDKKLKDKPNSFVESVEHSEEEREALRIFNLAVETEEALENRRGLKGAQKKAALNQVAELYMSVCASLSSQKEAGASIDVQLLDDAQWNLGVIQFKLGNVEKAFANLDAVRTRSPLESHYKTYYQKVKSAVGGELKERPVSFVDRLKAHKDAEFRELGRVLCGEDGQQFNRNLQLVETMTEACARILFAESQSNGYNEDNSLKMHTLGFIHCVCNMVRHNTLSTTDNLEAMFRRYAVESCCTR